MLRDLAELERLDGLPDELLADLGIVQNGSTAPATATEPDPQRKVRHPGRHAHLLGVGGAMRGRGEGKAAILAELRKVNRSDCDPPKSDEEIVALAEDLAARYEPEKLAQYKVTIDDKGRLELPEAQARRRDRPVPVADSVFNLDPSAPDHRRRAPGLARCRGAVELPASQRTAISLRAREPARRTRPVARSARDQRAASDGEVPGFKAERTTRSACSDAARAPKGSRRKRRRSASWTRSWPTRRPLRADHLSNSRPALRGRGRAAAPARRLQRAGALPARQRRRRVRR